jgi:hypothetical protein
MTSISDSDREQKQMKRAMRLLRLCEGGLESAVERAGGNLAGFSVKLSGYDVLLTLRADFPGGRMISWCGSSTLAHAIDKATREASADKLRWRPDKWASKQS